MFICIYRDIYIYIYIYIYMYMYLGTVVGWGCKSVVAAPLVCFCLLQGII